jgi:hypothetical protein
VGGVRMPFHTELPLSNIPGFVAALSDRDTPLFHDRSFLDLCPSQASLPSSHVMHVALLLLKFTSFFFFLRCCPIDAPWVVTCVGIHSTSYPQCLQIM